MSVLLAEGMTAPVLTKAARVAELRRRWADATRHMRWDEANQLWQELMLEWLKPTAVNQRYWNDLVAGAWPRLNAGNSATQSAISSGITHIRI